MAVLVCFCLMLICLSFVGIGRMHLVRALRGDMIASASEVARIASAVRQNDSLDSWLLGMNVSAIANSTENLIFIAEPGGSIVRCSDKPTNCCHLGLTLSENVLELARSDTEFGLTDLDGVFKEQRYVVSRGIYSEADGSCLGYVFVISSPGKIFGDWSAFLILASVVTLGILLVFLILTLFYSKRMARPLDEIAAASRKFARGDFSVRVKQEYDATDEMGALIDSFNKMADSLEAAEKRRSEFIANVSHELRTPMTTISGFADGILDGTIPPEEERKYLVSWSCVT